MKNDTAIARWLDRDPDCITKNELKQLVARNDKKELLDRFSGRLAFGTAGLRGKVGAGPNRMNLLVIQETALGLSHYLLSTVSDAKNKGVIIGYDCRPDSQRFAEAAACMLMSQGISVYLTEKVAPTPLVCFGVLHLNCAAAIVVTASHNPPAYNGFKVYWENGAQIIPPHDAGIAEEIIKAADSALPKMTLDAGEQQGLLTWLKADYYNAYRQAINNSCYLASHGNPETVSLSYSAMHGVGAELAEGLLKDAGFTSIYSVQAQREPDGTFPTLKFPNPEEAGAMDLAIAEAAKHSALLACANDPDADRFAAAVRTTSGGYKMLTGDQLGVLFAYYLLSHADASSESLVGTTIVSSSLLAKVAHAFDACYYETLTGFKWLSNVAIQKKTEHRHFLFAYEEALGYTIGSTTWDKDGLSALTVFAQMTAELATHSQSIWDRLEMIYRAHGMHLNTQCSIALEPGASPLGDALRANPPTRIAGRSIIKVHDLKALKIYHAGGNEETIDLPTSDVLIYHLSDGSRVVVRPSGTEPKIKCYYEVIEPFSEVDTMEQVTARAEKNMQSLIRQHQASL
ncbi:MAG: phospho-sugar mutase [Endozoicomonas sp. (ex Botrylloides leachii)]|nr:phospho-sugar mutase [Endozoicomonas sp. (ex Botrylloides leachii)]